MSNNDDFFKDFNRQSNRMFAKMGCFAVAIYAAIIALIAVAVIVVIHFV